LVFSILSTMRSRPSNNLWLFERLEEDRFGNPQLVQQRLRLDQMAGRRVFTSDHKQHGRFYCPAQNIPSSARLQMTLSGEQVVELDFQSMHVALAYGICGARMDGDPYDIPGFTRKQGKLGLLTAFNARTDRDVSAPSIGLQAAIASLTDNREGEPVCASRSEAQRLLAALKARHAPIEKMLCSDAGMRLMNLDARIMLASVDRLMGQGVACLPVHDSLVIAQQHEGAAREALHFGWCSQNPQITPCYIEKKRQKVSQYGAEGPGVLSHALAAPYFGCADVDSAWRSSVLAEARYDVVEWCGSSVK
jgi:hypothetical protein